MSEIERCARSIAHPFTIHRIYIAVHVRHEFYLFIFRVDSFHFFLCLLKWSLCVCECVYHVPWWCFVSFDSHSITFIIIIIMKPSLLFFVWKMRKKFQHYHSLVTQLSVRHIFILHLQKHMIFVVVVVCVS